MTEDIAILKEACSLIKHEKHGICWKGSFVSLSADLNITATREQTFLLPRIRFQYIIHDIWNICTIIHRLTWLREKVMEDRSLENLWFPYASVDIEHFHTELRSIMDYSAEIIHHDSNKKGQVPNKSFRILMQWLSNNPSNRTRIGEDLASVVQSASWFLHFRDVRDGLIHRGAFILVYGNPQDGILFQIYKDNTKILTSHDFLMFNENVVRFERYAAIYFSRVLVFLERLAEVLQGKYQIKSFARDASSGLAGLGIILSWMKNLVTLIEEQKANHRLKKDGQ